MNIYIISNYYNLNPSIFEIIKKEDLVVFMNHCFFDSSFFDNNKKILFIRKNLKSYWGYKKNYKNRYDEIYFINGKLDDKKIISNIDKCPKIIINIKDIIKIYPEDKSPTTGFIAYSYLREKFPDANIFLIGFTGGSSFKSKLISKTHNYKYEQEFYNINNVNLLHKEK